jgi:putative restriction endonuclease
VHGAPLDPRCRVRRGRSLRRRPRSRLPVPRCARPVSQSPEGDLPCCCSERPCCAGDPDIGQLPYDDQILADGFDYAYRAGPIDQPDNRALRAAHELQVPLVYFIGTRPGWYKPVFPCYVRDDDPGRRMVIVTPGVLHGPLDEPEWAPLEDPIERRYAVKQTQVRLHQARFRGRVVPAYSSQCAICRLKELRLLDAAHIVGDVEELGEPAVSNGLSICSIHHRAFDQNLVGISPDYVVHVSRRLREDEDGPMLDVLKGFHQVPLLLPRRAPDQPSRERLDDRFARFLQLSA